MVIMVPTVPTTTTRAKRSSSGPGVQAFEALAAAKEAGSRRGDGGVPDGRPGGGGYLQAGGHSALSTVFGLAADNALSFEVVAPRGDVLTASSTVNQDLYWAPSGGGGGSFGIVTSVTVKAHPDHMVAGASFQVSAPKEDPDRIFEAVDAFHTALPDIVDAGVMIIYFFGSGFLQVPALTAYGKSKEQVEQILLPLSDRLAALGLTLEPKYTEFPSYHDHYDHYLGPLPEGNIQVGTSLFRGRPISRLALANFSTAARQIAKEGVVFIGVGTDVSASGGGEQQPQKNSVLPQWRDAIVSASPTLPWSFQAPFQEMLETQRRITEVVQPIVERATPDSGAYINEADFLQPDWQEAFFGANHPELLRVKRKYDPAGLLYARVGVGSEAYEVRSDGRMCRVESSRTDL